MMKKLHFPYLLATSMWAAAIIVNADSVAFTETISSAKSQSLKKLADNLSLNGQTDRLTTGVGPYLGLQDRSPVRLYHLRSNDPAWVKRTCDLVFDKEGDGTPPQPNCFVLIDKKKHGNDVTITHYRYDLNGKFLSAHRMLGKDDADGKPIRGSAKNIELDPEDKKVQAEAEKLLNFWASGQYKKYLAETAAPAR